MGVALATFFPRERCAGFIGVGLCLNHPSGRGKYHSTHQQLDDVLTHRTFPMGDNPDIKRPV